MRKKKNKNQNCTAQRNAENLVYKRKYENKQTEIVCAVSTSTDQVRGIQIHTVRVATALKHKPTRAGIQIRSGQKDVGKRLTAWSVELLLYGTGIKRSCNSPPITFKSKG